MLGHGKRRSIAQLAHEEIYAVSGPSSSAILNPSVRSIDVVLLQELRCQRLTATAALGSAHQQGHGPWRLSRNQIPRSQQATETLARYLTSTCWHPAYPALNLFPSDFGTH